MEADPQPGAMGRHSGSPRPRCRHLLPAPPIPAPPAHGLPLAAGARRLPWVVGRLTLTLRAGVDRRARRGGARGGGGAGLKTALLCGAREGASLGLPLPDALPRLDAQHCGYLL